MTDTPMNPMNQAMNPTEPLKPNTNGMLRLFVYGTLKRGFWNHDRFCRGVLAVEDALVRGRLFETSSGIPVLQVPEEDILAVGTVNPLADVATQARFAEDLAFILKPVPGSATAGDWGPVYGELLTFGDPSTRLPAIDRLEGFHPGGSSMYQRVMVAVRVETAITPVWLYSMKYRSNWRRVANGRWEPL